MMVYKVVPEIMRNNFVKHHFWAIRKSSYGSYDKSSYKKSSYEKSSYEKSSYAVVTPFRKVVTRFRKVVTIRSLMKYSKKFVYYSLK